jgi:hypothetical protein
MAAAAFPRTQHWTVQGFRISVMLYMRSTDPCATCGQRPARHAVWAQGVKALEGFSGSPEHFCDDHRPAKGALPPLTYERLLAGGPAGYSYEGWQPYPDAECSVCAAPAVLRYGVKCQGCDDPQFRYSTTRIVPLGDGLTSEEAPEFRHLGHELAAPFRCREHLLTLAEVTR